MKLNPWLSSSVNHCWNPCFGPQPAYTYQDLSMHRGQRSWHYFCSQKLLNGVRLHLLHRLHYCCCCQQFDFLRACLLFPCNTRTILQESTNCKAMMGMGTRYFFMLLSATKLPAVLETQ